jgi:hypothetical protein
MDRATLVAFNIKLGDAIVAALDRAGYKPNVAMWAVFEEYGDARLVLASRKFDQKSLRTADEELLTALRTQGIDFHNRPPILVYRMTDKFIQALRHTFAKAQSVDGMRLGNQSFGGRYLEEGYVYRIS